MNPVEPRKKRPLEQLEFLFAMIAAVPGILMVTGGRVQNQAQATFRIVVFVVGVIGFVAIKIYQRRKAREAGPR